MPKQRQSAPTACPSSILTMSSIMEARVATEHLRHPIVAAVGRIFGSLRGSPIGYLSHDQSAHLIANRSEWLDVLVERAFNALARTLLLESARSGIGPRSVVRSNDWMRDTLHNLTERISDQVRFEPSHWAGIRNTCSRDAVLRQLSRHLYPSRSASDAPRAPIATRCWSRVSRSRMVTCASSSDSKSTVMQRGAPTSSKRR